MAYTVPQVIEYFHLAFIDVLRTNLDVGRSVLKGGANLRYFFNSPRYSEDIDFDVYGLEADWRFEEQIDKTVCGDALSRLLRSAQIRVDPEGVTKPKQTKTTRRWKVLLEDVRFVVEFGDGPPREYDSQTVTASVT